MVELDIAVIPGVGSQICGGKEHLDARFNIVVLQLCICSPPQESSYERCHWYRLWEGKAGRCEGNGHVPGELQVVEDLDLKYRLRLYMRYCRAIRHLGSSSIEHIKWQT